MVSRTSSWILLVILAALLLLATLVLALSSRHSIQCQAASIDANHDRPISVAEAVQAIRLYHNACLSSQELLKALRAYGSSSPYP